MTEKIASKRREYFNKYFEKNKEKLLEYVTCDVCGGSFQKTNKTNHAKTKQHKNYIIIQKLQKENETMKQIFSDAHKKYENI